METKEIRYLPDDLKKIIVSEEEIQAIVSRMAKEISRDYSGKKLLVCGILRGCFIFMADLVRQIDFPVTVSFIKASSYGSERESGDIKIIEFDGLDKYKNHDILIVDDILDTGNTFYYLEKYLRDKGFTGVNFCAFLDKPERRQSPVSVKYIGRHIENEFVVGYGLDFNEKYRNLPFVAAVK
jgi:hypoxanthine phosphoribosyltransferase